MSPSRCAVVPPGGAVSSGTRAGRGPDEAPHALIGPLSRPNVIRRWVRGPSIARPWAASRCKGGRHRLLRSDLSDEQDPNTTAAEPGLDRWGHVLAQRSTRGRSEARGEDVAAVAEAV